MKTLHLGTADALPFCVPLEIVTEKVAFLGRTGSGKTYSATKLAELLLDAGAQIVALDPVGVWRGLRMGGDFQIYIFGGQSGDFPLESTGGALVAELIVERGISAVLDVSQFGTDTEHRRFATDFATRFFHLKKTKPSAVHLFVEEAQEFIPQDKQHGDERMLHSFQRLWKLGRNFGIGGSIISQRPQDVNKKALNMSGTLFVHQMTAPGDRDVISRWVDEKGIDADVGAILPKIRVGQPHVWSPDFLKVSHAVAIALKTTADISSTPEVGQREKAQTLSPVDADKISRDMAATIERAKENDPAELKKKLAAADAELRRLKSAGPTTIQAKPLPPVEVPIFTDKDRVYLSDIAEQLSKVRPAFAALEATFEILRQGVAKHAPVSLQRSVPVRHPERHLIVKNFAPASAPARVPNGSGGIEMTGMHRKMLTALAQHPDGLTKAQILVHTCYSSSGPVSTAFAYLAGMGFVTSYGNVVTITQTGLNALGHYDPLPIGDELRAFLLSGNKLSLMEKKLLETVCAAYPEAIRKGDVLAQAGYASSGPVSTAFAKLVAYNYVISQGPSMLQAAQQLFN